MTNTATGLTAPGPLLSAWGAAATWEDLLHVLSPPPIALPPVHEVADPGALAAVRERAEGERAAPWPQPLASHYSRFFRDGNRTGYETPLFALQGRLTRAVLMALLSGGPVRVESAEAGPASGTSGSADRSTPPDGGDRREREGELERWLDEVADGTVLLCELSSWCWPAHEDTCRRRGTVLPAPAAPYLDLGAAGVAAQLAWVDHALGDRLDARYPGLRNRIRGEARHRVLDPFADRQDWHWLGLDGDVHNWCPWICGNVLVAALRLAEPGERRARLVAQAVAGIDRYLAALPADGSVDEGYEYWWNGACRALEALEVLEHATAGKLSGASVPVVRETVRFPYRMHLGGPWYVNFADARARPPADQPWHVLHRWSRRLGDPDGVRHARACRTPLIPVGAELGRALSEVADQDWHGPVSGGAGARTSEGPPLVGDVWLPGTQIALARSEPGTSRGLTLVIKGGHNGEHHNHNDVGSVIVAVDCVPVIVDAGRPTYTAQTFGPDRYAIWTMQSAWHNVPEVRGVQQGQGRAYAAGDVAVTRDEHRCEVRMDLAGAYPVHGLKRWLRTATLDRRAGCVTLEDVWSMTGDGPPSLVRLLLNGEVREEPGQVLITPPGGGRGARITWDAGLAAATLTTRKLDDLMLSDVWGKRMTRLELRLPGTARGRFEVQVEVRR